MFSSRLGYPAVRNRLALALERRRGDGLPTIDLTLSNPTHAGFAYSEGLLRPLGDARGLRYDPHPFGLAAARKAVSVEFARRKQSVPAERIILTASTSEAYSLLFKLLCDPGDTVLAPRPSYPLIEHLAGLDGVSLESYSLEFHGQWAIDLEELRRRFAEAGDRPVRAVIMISPNNPTGSVTKAHELDAIAALAASHGAAVISDEVFADYSINADRPCTSALARDTALTFALGGLSKSIGLPQAKLSWFGVNGPAPVVEEALERLETICDAYLSVSTPVQAAASDLLAAGTDIRAQIQRRVAGNYAALVAAAAAYPACSVLPVEAGWYGVLQVPAVQSEEALALHLLDTMGVLVHPGYFFDFDREAFLVISLLPAPEIFSPATHALLQEIDRIS